MKQNAGPSPNATSQAKKIWGEHIAIGTATDPYQPAEREFGATRAILEKMAEREGLSLSITTKSNQVVRDIDVIKRIAERSSITIHMTITTMRTRLARLLEPRAPRPDLRLDALRQLRAAGIDAGVNAMPVLPGLTDREEDLDALARGARDAGAQWIAASALFLMPSSLKQFLPFIDAKFPKLAKRYREWYAHNGYAPESYRKEISARFEALRRKYNLGSRPERRSAEKQWRSPQLAAESLDVVRTTMHLKHCRRQTPFRGARHARLCVPDGLAGPCPALSGIDNTTGVFPVLPHSL